MRSRMRNLQFNNLYSPEDSTGKGAEETETFELLNVEEEPEETLELPKGEKKDEESEDTETGAEEEVDELKEIEEELKAPTEEDLLELTTPVRRKEILAKYPKLFKDFPYLEKAYYREQQFTELLPTVADAKMAVEKAAILDRTEREVMNGDISIVLQAAKSESQESFNKIADNYLPTLRKVDQQAYYHVLGGVIKDTIITMVREGRALGEQGAPLQAAANVLNQFIFGSQNFQPHQPLSKQPRPEDQGREEQIRQEDQQRIMSHFTSVKDDLQTRADNVLKSTIDSNIDPRGSMSEFVKRHATAEAFNNLEELISKDTRFRSLLDKLWEKAFESRFDKTSTDRIKSAYLSKAKTLLPSVIKKARNDALKGSGKHTEDEEVTEKKGPIQGAKPTSSPSKYKSAKDIPRGMTTLDVLMKD
jgi:hypothetical protein